MSPLKSAVAALALSFGLGARAQPTDHRELDPKRMHTSVEPKLTTADQDFVTAAALANLAEIEMGRLAAKPGHGQATRDFGEKLIVDHTRLNKALDQVARGYGVMLPGTIDDEHQHHLDLLSAKTDAQFDAAFAQHMVKGHEGAVALFARQAKVGEAPPLKAFATDSLPTLKQHLAAARALARTTMSSR